MGFIRLFLALTVAGDHFFLVVLDRNGYGTRGIDQWVWLNGGFAVMLFYTISGFLISYALAHKYQEAPGGTSAFYRSRFVRIFSLYWPMLIFAVALHRPGPEGLFDWLASVFIIGGDWITAFRNYPAEYNPYFDILGPIWSVAAELAFYAIAPVLLRSLRWTITLFIGSLMLRLTLQSTFGFHQAWTYHFFPSAFWCFMAGDLARRIGDWGLKNHRWVEALMLLSGIVSLRISAKHGSWTGPWFYIMILSVALALPWLFDRTKDNRILNFLGDLTYPIYLIHGSVHYLHLHAVCDALRIVLCTHPRWGLRTLAHNAGHSRSLCSRATVRDSSALAY
jgi:peptidoglycan/LPS O-acetylase OafA/YrhL